MVKNLIVKDNFYEEINDETLLKFILIIPNFLNNNYVRQRFYKIIVSKLLNTNTFSNNNIFIN